MLSDKLLKSLFLFSVCFLLMISGMVIYHYKLPPSSAVADAFTAGEAWYEALQESMKKEEVVRKGRPENRPINAEVIWDKKLAYEGYTLFSYRYSYMVELLNMEGEVVYRWYIPFSKAFPNPTHVHTGVNARPFVETAHVFPNGDLLVQYTGIGDTPYGYGMVKIDKDSNVLWRYAKNAHHDFHIDKDGYIYTLTHSLMTDPPSDVKGIGKPLLVDYIVKLSPDGEELDKISLLDAFRGSDFELLLYHKQKSSRGKGWDVFHTNTIRKLEPDMAKKFPMFKPGSFLVSMRAMNAIAVIDPDTRKVIWAYPGDWHWQHGARFTDDGTLLVMDNLGHYTGERNYTKVVEFDPQTLRTVWYIAGNEKQPFRSVAYGRTQRLPNGNTLINFGFYKQAIEYTKDGKVAWHYRVVKNRGKYPIQSLNTSERYAKDALPFLKEVTDAPTVPQEVTAQENAINDSSSDDMDMEE